MARGEGTVTRLIQGARAGDAAAKTQLWDRYYIRLVKVANARLRTSKVPLIEGSEVAAADALLSLFEGLEGDRFDRMNDRDDLWRLVVLITKRKAFDQIERAVTQKAGGGRVVHESTLACDEDGRGALDARQGAAMAPEVIAMAVQECGRLLDLLPDGDHSRDIAVWKMEGFTSEEIAEKLGVHKKTIANRLAKIRESWEADRP